MHDLRMAAPAATCWGAAAWLVSAGSRTCVVVAVSAVIAGAVLLRLPYRARLGPVVAAICLSAIAVSCAWRLATIENSPVTGLASGHRMATLELQVRRDARPITQHGRSSAVVEVLVRRVVTRGADLRTRDRATAFVDGDAQGLVAGRRFMAWGRLAAARHSDESAVIDVVRRGPVEPGRWWWEVAEDVREGVRRSVGLAGAEARALVPALVDGDDAAISDRVEEDFRRSGLTHLMAVSGTNLTIVLAMMLVVAKAVGARRRLLWLLGAVSVAGFVVLARPDPSVVRAAAMGVVGLAALGHGGRGGVRALSWAVIALVFIDPWLSRSIGFILSVSATAGILLLGPVLARPLTAWLPRWCAVAISVPLAAQLACTPALAAISGQVSLVAVIANLLAGPAVAPATVAGLLGGLMALVSVPLSHVAGVVAGGCASWILAVGHHAASLESASVAWHAPWQWLLAVVPLVAWGVVRLASRPLLCVGVSLGLLIAIWRPPHTGWPPPGWLMVACDVGQGDATVLDAGGGSAVVVDAGPEPAAVDHCLDRLGIRRVRLMVFTHAHADHIDGWPGVRRGRRVDQIAVGPTGGPTETGVPRHLVIAGESFTVGGISADVLWPASRAPVVVHGAEGSVANNASVVLAVRMRGVRLLLTGDIEPFVQDRLVTQGADLHADVVKMPHHGSARQSPRFFDAVGAGVATISAGRDNDYGHPAATALSMLRRHGVRWWRTDTDGDIAVVEREGRLLVVTR